MEPACGWVNVETTHERLVLSVVLACTACRLDKLIDTPPPAGLGVAPSQVAESTSVGTASGSIPLAVSSAQASALAWTAYREAGSPWLTLTDSVGVAPATLWVTLDATGLLPGTYRDVVVVVPDELGLSRVRVPVELRIDPLPALPAAGR
jgi:hypothetical protein